MKRRNFLSRIFGGAVAVAAAPVIVKAIEPTPSSLVDSGPIIYTTTGTLYRWIDGKWLPMRLAPSGSVMKIVDGVPHWLGTTT